MPLLGLTLICSYDIACQWKINFKSRMVDLPSSLQLTPDTLNTMSFGIPKFHGPAHELKCQAPHSLNLMAGVGRTDGEGIERNWSEMNGVASSTTEMGPGSRHDTLDDHFNHRNFQKYIKMGEPSSPSLCTFSHLQNLLKGDILRRKLLLAVPERNRQRAAHAEFTLMLPNGTFETEWTAQVHAWDLDHDQFNPYVVATTCQSIFNFCLAYRCLILICILLDATQAEVRHQLAEEERVAMEQGAAMLHETTASAFLATGLMLEESQYVYC